MAAALAAQAKNDLDQSVVLYEAVLKVRGTFFTRTLSLSPCNPENRRLGLGRRILDTQNA